MWVPGMELRPLEEQAVLSHLFSLKALLSLLSCQAFIPRQEGEEKPATLEICHLYYLPLELC